MIKQQKIPKYKRDSFVFVSNLKAFTANAQHPVTFRRDAYLLSEYYQNEESLKLSKLVKKKRNLLISDNGNFSRIKKTAKRFEEAGHEILKEGKRQLEENGEISPATLALRSNLMQSIDEACRIALEKQDRTTILANQVAIRPNYLIGFEDYTIPALHICGMLDPIFSPQAKEVLRYQKATIKLYSRQLQGIFGSKEELRDIVNFLVIHAFDFPSAFQGVQTANATLKDGIAISYGGPLRSRRYISSINLGGDIETFDEPLPEPYLASVALSLGITNGNTIEHLPYHILGVGSPILIAILGYVFRKSKAISIDSTAPFKDAFAGTIYGSRSALLKMDMYKVVAHALKYNKPFKSRTPFFQMFEDRFPSDWPGLRKALPFDPNWSISQLAKVLKGQDALLEQFTPFFSKMRAGNDEMMSFLRIARTGHNYWIIRNICKNILERRKNPQALQAWFEKEIQRYQKYGSSKWAKAVSKCYQLIVKYEKK